MPGAAGRISLRMYVAAEDHQGLDRFSHECRRLVDVGEGIRPGPGGLGVPGPGRIDLGFDHARVAVVDGPEHGDGAAVAAGVADEQLPRSGLAGCRSPLGRVAHVPWAAFWAACATVSLSAKPLILAASLAGRT